MLQGKKKLVRENLVTRESSEEIYHVEVSGLDRKVSPSLIRDDRTELVAKMLSVIPKTQSNIPAYLGGAFTWGGNHMNTVARLVFTSRNGGSDIHANVDYRMDNSH